MKKIKAIHIQNFLTHKDTKLDFHENITMLIGPSGTGKTSAIRAIKLVTRNEPRGDKYIMIGETKASVTLQMEDDVEIVRERSTGSINRYTVLTPDGEVEEFNRFGSIVPPTVWEALDYKPVVIDSELTIDINFADQLAGHFLITETNSTKSKIIDGLAKINVFSIALKSERLERDRAREKLKPIQRDIEGLYGNLEELGDINALEEQTNALESLLEVYEEKEKRLLQLERLHKLYEENSEKMSEVENVLKLGTNIFKSDALMTKLEAVVQRGHALYNLASNYKNIVLGINELQPIINYKDAIQESERKLDEVQKYERKLNQLTTMSSGYLSITTAIDKGTVYIDKIKKVISKEKHINEAAQLELKVSKLENLNHQHINNQSSLEELEVQIDKYKPLNSIGEKLDKVTTIEEVVRKTTALEDNLKRIDKEIQNKEEFLSKKADVLKAERLLLETEKITDRINQLTLQESRYNSLTKEIELIEAEVESSSQTVAVAKGELEQLLKGMEVCPTCLQEVGDSHIHDVIS